jgi:hypothetical protein
LYCSEFFYLNSNKKNYLCNIKSEKNENVLMLIDGEKYKKINKKTHEQYCSILYSIKQGHEFGVRSTSPAFRFSLVQINGRGFG